MRAAQVPVCLGQAGVAKGERGSLPMPRIDWYALFHH